MFSRAQLLDVAMSKLSDGRLLLQHGRWSNSYYLYGYAIEILLKAIIASLFRADEIPDRKFVDQVHTHDLQRLVGLAKLAASLDDRRRDLEFSRRWSVVVRWDEAARYRLIGADEAREMADAIEEPAYGVFAWLRPHLPSPP